MSNTIDNNTLRKISSVAADVANILMAADINGDGKITSNELYTTIYNALLGLEQKDTTQASFKGIQKGNKVLSVAKIEERIQRLEDSADHTHDASHITSGVLSIDRIPNLAANKITSGTFSADRIPNIDASKITGTLTRPLKLKQSVGVLDAYLNTADITDIMYTEGNDHRFNGLAYTATESSLFRVSDSRLADSSGTASDKQVGAFQALVSGKGEVYTRLYTRNCWNNQYTTNDFRIIVDKKYLNNAVRVFNKYSCSDPIAFHQGIYSHPSLLGIHCGQTNISVSASYMTETGYINFPTTVSVSSKTYNVPSYPSGHNPAIFLSFTGSWNDSDVDTDAKKKEYSEIMAGLTLTTYSVSNTKFKIRVHNATKKAATIVVNWMSYGAFTPLSSDKQGA